MSVQLADATVRVNNDVWAIVPNSLEFTEGQGEQEIKAASTGGGGSEQVYVEDVESKFSTLKFQVYSTVQSVKDTKKVKANKNRNLVSIEGRTDDGVITRSFSQAAMLNDPAKVLTRDGVIDVEFKSNPAI